MRPLMLDGGDDLSLCLHILFDELAVFVVVAVVVRVPSEVSKGVIMFSEPGIRGDAWCNG